MIIGNKILKFSSNGKPYVIEAPSSTDEGLDDEELSRISATEKRANEMLAEAIEKSKRAEEKLKNAELQASVIEKSAQDDKEQLIADTKAQAEADAEKMLEEAQKKGYDEGFKKGQKEGNKKGQEDGEKAVRKELKDTINKANAKAEKTLQDAKELTADYFVRAEDDIVKIVMMAIEKILPQHFLDVPQAVLPVVRETIKYVRDQKEIKVHVDPDSYDLVLMARNDFQNMLTDGTAILEVVSDESLKPGDCVVETPNGGVDARLLTQIELMKDAVKKVLNK